MSHAKTNLWLTGVLLCLGVPAGQPAADNTNLNARDRYKSQTTADRTKENVSGRELTQQIRKASVTNQISVKADKASH